MCACVGVISVQYVVFYRNDCITSLIIAKILNVNEKQGSDFIKMCIVYTRIVEFKEITYRSVYCMECRARNSEPSQFELGVMTRWL